MPAMAIGLDCFVALLLAITGTENPRNVLN